MIFIRLKPSAIPSLLRSFHININWVLSNAFIYWDKEVLTPAFFCYYISWFFWVLRQAWIKQIPLGPHIIICFLYIAFLLTAWQVWTLKYYVRFSFTLKRFQTYFLRLLPHAISKYGNNFESSTLIELHLLSP